jgi:hypothetical protein
LEGLVKYEWRNRLDDTISSTANTCIINTPGSYSVTAKTIISQNNISEETPANFEVVAVPFDSPILSTNFSKKAVIKEG